MINWFKKWLTTLDGSLQRNLQFKMLSDESVAEELLQTERYKRRQTKKAEACCDYEKTVAVMHLRMAKTREVCWYGVVMDAGRNLTAVLTLSKFPLLASRLSLCSRRELGTP